jgi:hypothetical protein
MTKVIVSAIVGSILAKLPTLDSEARLLLTAAAVFLVLVWLILTAVLHVKMVSTDVTEWSPFHWKRPEKPQQSADMPERARVRREPREGAQREQPSPPPN